MSSSFNACFFASMLFVKMARKTYMPVVDHRKRLR